VYKLLFYFFVSTYFHQVKMIKTVLLKGLKLKTVVISLMILFINIMAGCNGTAGQKLKPGKELLSVDFQKGQTLRYKFVSSKDITVDWGEVKSGKKTQHKVNKSSESMEMVVAYEPVEVNPFGLTTIKATYESVKAKRSEQKRSHKDAVESFVGKSFVFDIDATGKIKDYSQLDNLIRQAGQKSFRPDTSRGRIKDPDMIADFIASQWFLWDCLSSVTNPIKGVSIGENWQSKLSVPTPMIMRIARDVVYTLGEIRETDKGRVAVIDSSYSLAKSVPLDWPKPYPSGKFQMSGRFGFFRNYRVLDLQGQGSEEFNIDAGRIERYNQSCKIQVQASLMMPLGPQPKITIDQILTMELLEN
jgi:hypothetical protein